MTFEAQTLSALNDREWVTKSQKDWTWLMEIFNSIEKTVSPQYFPDFTLLGNVPSKKIQNAQIKRSTCVWNPAPNTHCVYLYIALILNGTKPNNLDLFYSHPA